MEKVLLDTDVILDFFFAREPFVEDIEKILTLCERKRIVGYITPVIISNTYYMLRKTATHSKVIKKLKLLLTIIKILDMNESVVLKALDSEFKDFEDALQNYSAANSGFIDVIVTRNLKYYRKSEIGALSPQDYLKTFLLDNEL